MNEQMIESIWKEKKANNPKITYLQLKKLIEWAENNLKKANLDAQAIDFSSCIDSQLTYKENKENLRKILIGMGVDLRTPKEIEAEQEVAEMEMTAIEEEYYKEQFEKKIEEIKQSAVVELNEYFRSYYEHIDAFLNNNIVNGFICVGAGGMGKTFNLIFKLKEKNISFKILKGHTSALSFYRYLYENREKQYIIIDDISKLISDRDIISLLLGALDYQQKIVAWTSNSPLTADLPSSFIFNSKVFILANDFDSDNEFLKALKDRCIFYEMKFSKEQIIQMLYILAKKRGYPIELIDYIKELSESNVINNLSLRLLDKIYPYYSKKNWKELIKDILEMNELENLVYQLMKSGKLVKEQVAEFIEKTGLSRTYFFYIKAKILGKTDSWYSYNRKKV